MESSGARDRPHALRHHEHALSAAAGVAEDPTSVASPVETLLAYVLGAVARATAEAQTRPRTGLIDGLHAQFPAPRQSGS